ncbi:MAG TPA: hypothetical protein VK534_02070 [Methylomirabilota bacterium]|nr:hypothetical protein [Methylomirabilota bacterium]
MENVPTFAEDDTEKDSDNKTTKSKSLGFLAVESKPKDDKEPAPLQALLEKFEKQEKQEDVPDIKVEAAPVPEAEAPLEEIAKPEEKVIVQTLAKHAKQEIAEQPVEAEPAPEKIAADQAVEQMYDEIIEGKDLDEAFSEVLADMGVEAEPEVKAEKPPEVTAETTKPPRSMDPEEEVVIDREDQSEVDNNGGINHTPPPITPGFNAPNNQPPQFENAATTPSAGESSSRPERSGQASPAAMALMGGIIGYLIGRRRGRIKTEKKLLPIQKKLEKQVEDLDWQLKEKEAKIRKAVAEKFVEDPNKPESPAHIGQMLVSAEAEPKTPTESHAQEAINTESNKRLETLSRAELLALSETISIDGSSLRQIYETHLIGEQGLRRLVAEHLEGGDLRLAIKREIVEKEMNFERDPAQRKPATQDGINNNVGTQLGDMIGQASSVIAPDQDNIQSPQDKLSHNPASQLDKQRTMDIVLVVFISLLAVTVAGLFIARM